MADLQQALPTQFPDLGTMFQYAPALAAMQSGQQTGIAQQNNQSLQDAFSNQEAFKQQQRPLELQGLQADNALKGAHAGYFNAEAGAVGQRTGELTQTQPGRMAATNAENATKIGADKIKAMEQFGQRLRMAGAMASSAVTPWEKVSKVKTALGDSVPDTPEFNDFLMKHATDNNLHQYLIDYGNNIFQQSQAYQMEKLKEERETERAKIAAEATKYGADQGTLRTDKELAGGKYSHHSQMNLLIKSMGGNFQQQAGAWNMLASQATDPNDKAYYEAQANSARQQDIQSRGAGQATGNELKVDPNKMLNTPPPQPPQAVPVPQRGVPGGPTQSPGPSIPGMPPGTRANPDGTLTLPDGRIIRKKQ